jgi:formate hydrogenlyase subunit 6/NADH:ubiquinone oxidoreductase subunit I
MLKALFTSIRNSFRKPVTELYPTVKPNNTIVMLERPEQTDPKLKHRPIIDLNRCIFCGYCAEVCPAKCLFMGRSYEMAGKNKAELLFTYKDMIELPARPDNGRVIYPKIEGENALRIELENINAAEAKK